MISRLKITLSVVSYERKKNIFFYGKSSKLTKNNTFNNLSSNRIFPSYRFIAILFFYQSGKFLTSETIKTIFL